MDTLKFILTCYFSIGFGVWFGVFIVRGPNEIKILPRLLALPGCLFIWILFPVLPKNNGIVDEYEPW